MTSQTCTNGHALRHTFREGLLLASAVGVGAGWWSSSAGDFGDGKESLGTLESTAMTSTFSWELRGSAASLLGTGVMLDERLAKDSELAFVVSLRQVDGTLSFFEVDGVADAEEAGALALALGLGLGWAAFEKKPKMLCCFALDEGVFAGVRAGVLAGFSPIFSQMTGQFDSIIQIHTSDKNSTQKDKRRQTKTKCATVSRLRLVCGARRRKAGLLGEGVSSEYWTL